MFSDYHIYRPTDDAIVRYHGYVFIRGAGKPNFRCEDTIDMHPQRVLVYNVKSNTILDMHYLCFQCNNIQKCLFKLLISRKTYLQRKQMCTLKEKTIEALVLTA